MASDRTLFAGWDDFTTEFTHMKSHNLLLERDLWRPAWIVWYAPEWRDDTTRARREAMTAWMEAKCVGRHRHFYDGVYEFDLRADAEAFDNQWSGVPGDWAGVQYEPVELTPGTKLVECGGEGFLFTLYGRKEGDTWTAFWIVTNKILLYDAMGSTSEILPPPVQESPHVTTWPEAVAMLHELHWAHLYPMEVHAEFRSSVWQALKGEKSDNIPRWQRIACA